MLLKDRQDEIKSFLSKGSVLTAEEERYCYSADASNLGHCGKVPDSVVFVETENDVRKVLEYANKYRIPVVSRGAGTNMVGACVCTRGGIVLNFSRMNKILDINPVNMTATVQPGVILGDLKHNVEQLGLFYPPDPSNYKVSTIGGSIAQASGGALAFKYGTTKDYILSLKVITAEGKLMQLGTGTVKNACGYNLVQLMVGSEGTLGIITEAVLKLIPKPEAVRTVAAYFDSIDAAFSAVDSVITEHIFPSAIDFMDKNSMLTSEAFAHCGLRTENECMLLIDIDGSAAAMQEVLSKVQKIMLKSGAAACEAAQSEEQSALLWKGRRSSFAAVARLAPDVLSDDIIVPRENIAEMVKNCNNISKKYNLKMCLVGHVGDGNIHPQVALNLEDEDEYKSYISAKSEMYKAAISMGGTISAEHGIGIAKLSYLENTINRDALEYMKSIKQIFDPNNILNPDKIFKL